jgi:hypothetical protein
VQVRVPPPPPSPALAIIALPNGSKHRNAPRGHERTHDVRIPHTLHPGLNRSVGSPMKTPTPVAMIEQEGGGETADIFGWRRPPPRLPVSRVSSCSWYSSAPPFRTVHLRAGVFCQVRDVVLGA